MMSYSNANYETGGHITSPIMYVCKTNLIVNVDSSLYVFVDLIQNDISFRTKPVRLRIYQKRLNKTKWLDVFTKWVTLLRSNCYHNPKFRVREADEL